MKLLPLLFRWHRRIGVLIALPVLVWTLSGVLHPLMSRMNPQPVQMMAPHAMAQADREIALTPALALQQAGITQLRALRLVNVEGREYYQAIDVQTGVPRYVDVLTGAENFEADLRFALQLALHFSGRTADQVSNVIRVENFDEDYLWINRLLPVWRVDFSGDDHLAAYVETAPARLASLVDDTKRFNTALFNGLHKWQWLPAHPLLTALMVLLLVLAALVAVGGVLLYGLQWQRGVVARSQRTGLIRWHRSLGLGISLCAFLFAFSGAYHLLYSPTTASTSSIPLPVWPVSALGSATFGDLFARGHQVTMVGCGDSVCRLAPPAMQMRAEHDHGGADSRAGFALVRVSDHSAQVFDNVAANAAREALGAAADTAVASFSTVTDFAGEYGFLNKRLPVLRIELATADHATVYWEPATGAVAAVMRDPDRYEGYSFGFLHKYHWLDAAGKDVRDAVAALASLLVAVVTMLGVMLWWRRQRQ